MSKQYDTIVYIGRFQPFHNGHMETYRQACKLASHILFLVGSANKAPDIRNPWSFVNRKTMIYDAIDGPNPTVSLGLAPGAVKVDVAPLDDFPYNDNAWVEQVQRVVRQWTNAGSKVAIIGFNSDHTSYYLDLFPQWDKIEVEEKVVIHATDIRNKLFGPQQIDTQHLPDGVSVYIRNWMAKYPQEFRRLQIEWEHIGGYKLAWANAPYPPTFVTVDAVVVQSGHILLVQRKAAPGEGLWALPGGFVNQTEGLTDAMMRELREETRLKVPPKVLRGSVKGQRVFDAPDRSLRGRTITHAYYIELNPGELPPVKGGDDAKAAKWVSFLDFAQMEKEMFEDHFAIVQSFVNLERVS